MDHIAYASNGVARMTTTKSHDNLNRLWQISSSRTPGSAPGPAAFTYDYQYNDANQRVRVSLPDGSFWSYAYDKLGQVISAKRYWADNTPVAGQQFEYTFDDIGNRTQTKAGGDSAGGSLRTATYTANRLNQYSSRVVPGTNDIVGSAASTATVLVNLQSTYRKGEYYQKALVTNNATAPVYFAITNRAGLSGVTNIAIGNLFVPQTPENFVYDLDGNLTSDGRWNYTWDAENRLVRMVTATAVGPPHRIDFEYDWRGRRIRKTVWNNTGGTGTPAVNRRFLYDDWNLVAILDGNNANAILQFFVWGTDLSGSFQGAGGVGGLLWVSDYQAGTAGTYFPAFDGNGNVVALVSAADGSVAAQYEYDAFGAVIRSSGLMAKANPFRFSTKFQDDESGLLYYGFRYYNASTGRWLLRDFLAENDRQGMQDPSASNCDLKNLYAFVQNTPVTRFDNWGLFAVEFETVPAYDPFWSTTIQSWFAEDVSPGRFYWRLPRHPLRITVEKCEVVMLIDHGYYDPAKSDPINDEYVIRPHRFVFPKTGACSAGGFMGCWAEQNNREIQFKVDGLPSWTGKVKPIDSEWRVATDNLRGNLISTANRILAAGCCKLVNVYVINALDGNVYHFTVDKNGASTQNVEEEIEREFEKHDLSIIPH